MMQDDYQEYQLGIQTDAGELGWGGTVPKDVRVGVLGEEELRGVWDWKERRTSITWSDFKSFRLFLESECGRGLGRENFSRVRLPCGNQALVYIVRGMVSASKVIMKELRVMERLLRTLNMKVETAWILSSVNVFADRLSRQWDPGDIQVKKRIPRSLRDSCLLGEEGEMFHIGHLDWLHQPRGKWQRMR